MGIDRTKGCGVRCLDGRLGGVLTRQDSIRVSGGSLDEKSRGKVGRGRELLRGPGGGRSCSSSHGSSEEVVSGTNETLRTGNRFTGNRFTGNRFTCKKVFEATIVTR